MSKIYQVVERETGDVFDEYETREDAETVCADYRSFGLYTEVREVVIGSYPPLSITPLLEE